MNLALLCKWLWRFRVDRKALWVRVISALYGPSGDLNLAQTPTSSGPWAAIIKAALDVYIIVPSFQNSFKRFMGCDSSILFWQDTCIGDGLLSIRFSRLFALDYHKNATIANKALLRR